MEQIQRVNHISFPCDKGRWILKTAQREGWKIERRAPHHTQHERLPVCIYVRRSLSLSRTLQIEFLHLSLILFLILSLVPFSTAAAGIIIIFRSSPASHQRAFHYNATRRRRSFISRLLFPEAAFICRHFSPLERANSLQQHFFPVYTAFSLSRYMI